MDRAASPRWAVEWSTQYTDAKRVARALANRPTPQPKSIAVLPMPPPDQTARAPWSRAIFDVRAKALATASSPVS